jgi:hypothetical protein
LNPSLSSWKGTEASVKSFISGGLPIILSSLETRGKASVTGE